MPVVQTASYRQNYESPKTSESNGNGVVQDVGATENTVAVSNATKMPDEYKDAKIRRALEGDLDKLLRQIFPDLGVKFKVHESGAIITSVIDRKTDEVIREIPAEKILDIIHSMCQRIGMVTNKKV